MHCSITLRPEAVLLMLSPEMVDCALARLTSRPRSTSTADAMQPELMSRVHHLGQHDQRLHLQ